MSGEDIRRASLADIRRMKERGELFHDPNAPEGPPEEYAHLDEAFWASAKVVSYRKPRSVHLKLDPDVFEFFHTQAGGKGHLTRMQNVLKAYANAHRPDHGPRSGS